MPQDFPGTNPANLRTGHGDRDKSVPTRAALASGHRQAHPPQTHREPHVRRDYPSPAQRGAHTDRSERQSSIALPPLSTTASKGLPPERLDAAGALAPEPQLLTSEAQSDLGLLSWDTLQALRGRNGDTYCPNGLQ